MGAHRKLPRRDLGGRQFGQEALFFAGAGQVILGDVHGGQHHLVVILDKEQAGVAAAVARADIGHVGLQVEEGIEAVSASLPALADGKNADDQVGVSGGMQLLFIDLVRCLVVADPAFPERRRHLEDIDGFSAVRGMNR